jgi:hypothetical protein
MQMEKLLNKKIKNFQLKYRDTWRTLLQFQILKNFLDKVKEVFVHSPTQRGQYIVHLKMHSSPCKIPLYNKTCWILGFEW